MQSRQEQDDEIREWIYQATARLERYMRSDDSIVGKPLNRKKAINVLENVLGGLVEAYELACSDDEFAEINSMPTQIDAYCMTTESWFPSFVKVSLDLGMENKGDIRHAVTVSGGDDKFLQKWFASSDEAVKEFEHVKSLVDVTSSALEKRGFERG